MDEVELPEMPELEREIRKDHFNTVIAITVTIIVTFMAFCKIQDNNIVLNMQKAQAEKIDKWSWYQSLHIREEINNSKLTDLDGDLQEEDSLARHKIIQSKIDAHHAVAKKIEDRKTEVKEAATKNDELYEKLDKIHEYFDYSEAAISIAVSLLALTSLLQKRWLYGVALIPATAGIIKGLMGLIA
jgi:hypothetical protein